MNSQQPVVVDGSAGVSSAVVRATHPRTGHHEPDRLASAVAEGCRTSNNTVTQQMFPDLRDLQTASLGCRIVHTTRRDLHTDEASPGFIQFLEGGKPQISNVRRF